MKKKISIKKYLNYKLIINWDLNYLKIFIITSFKKLSSTLRLLSNLFLKNAIKLYKGIRNIFSLLL